MPQRIYSLIILTLFLGLLILVHSMRSRFVRDIIELILRVVVFLVKAFACEWEY